MITIRILVCVVLIALTFILFKALKCSRTTILMCCLVTGVFFGSWTLVEPLDLSDKVTRTETVETVITDTAAMSTAHGYEYIVSTPYNGGTTFRLYDRDDYALCEAGMPVMLTIYYIGDTLYDIRIGGLSMVDSIPLRDAHVLTQMRMLEEIERR